MATAAAIIVGTENDLNSFDAKARRKLLAGATSALTAESDSMWAIIEGRLMFNPIAGADWRMMTGLPAAHTEGANCLLATPAGLLLGTSGAHLFRFANSTWERVEAFEVVEGRQDWYTPWGGPPDVRSLSYDGQGNIYANVHVGGILKSGDGGRTWHPTIDIDADVHQVLALPSTLGAPGRSAPVLAATARGLGISEDGGATWRFDTGGLDGAYCRAVAVTDTTLFLTASTGPGGRRAGIYRRSLSRDTNDSHFERCRIGLPEWFSSNIDTYCLSASRQAVAFGTDTGSMFASWDEGESWQEEATGLAPVRCVLVR